MLRPTACPLTPPYRASCSQLRTRHTFQRLLPARFVAPLVASALLPRSAQWDAAGPAGCRSPGAWPVSDVKVCAGALAGNVLRRVRGRLVFQSALGGRGTDYTTTSDMPRKYLAAQCTAARAADVPGTLQGMQSGEQHCS